MNQPKIEIDRVFGCHLWLGKRDARDGRALIFRGRKPFAAYIAAYQDLYGDVPEGKVLDHLCRRPHCVAPHHLEPVTKDENEKRKSWRYRARRARCPRGHDLKLTVIVTPEGGRVCRTCNRDAGATA